MTGLLDGLRAWLGSFFGDGTDGDDAPPDDEDRFAGESPTVVHRDDRPLETPSDLDPSPPSEGETSSGTVPNAATTEDGDDTSGDGEDVERPDRVSIPDAESVAGGTDAPTAGERAVDVDDPTGDREMADDDPTGDVVCAVCGTAVEDPTGACPLCGSTDVRSAEAGDGPPGSPRGRTTVSAADDEAVDRLGDVRSGEGDGDGG
ncbi:hypothetical protein EI982_17280 [Haloplanus rallus]|jgi:hypothetical protein|uniref:Uncharacterized protein n=1 Tax=Haloplanus rallus TaxID=1816183 RepID=A0A6B9F779_9EURY|nr:hypothetical protein [Haloplanus rallus]QGX96405.1 hypothetical protein EI982_17280 [Haloplanus rallus]